MYLLLIMIQNIWIRFHLSCPRAPDTGGSHAPFQDIGYTQPHTCSNIASLYTEVTRRSSAKNLKTFYQNETQFQHQATKKVRSKMHTYVALVISLLHATEENNM